MNTIRVAVLESFILQCLVKTHWIESRVINRSGIGCVCGGFLEGGVGHPTGHRDLCASDNLACAHTERDKPKDVIAVAFP
jgi:hypothetical protein